MQYLWWYDDNPKKRTEQKVKEAAQAYAVRFGASPNTILMSAADLCDIPGLVVRSEGHIRKNNFWIGVEA